MATASVWRHGTLEPGGRICKALSPHRDLPRRLLQPGNHSINRSSLACVLCFADGDASQNYRLRKIEMHEAEHPLVVKLRLCSFKDISPLEGMEMRLRWPDLWNRKCREWKEARAASVELELMALNAQFRGLREEALKLGEPPPQRLVYAAGTAQDCESEAHGLGQTQSRAGCAGHDRDDGVGTSASPQWV